MTEKIKWILQIKGGEKFPVWLGARNYLGVYAEVAAEHHHVISADIEHCWTADPKDNMDTLIAEGIRCLDLRTGCYLSEISGKVLVHVQSGENEPVGFILDGEDQGRLVDFLTEKETE